MRWRRSYRKRNRHHLEGPPGRLLRRPQAREESHSRTVETRVSAWRAFRNRSSRATPAGMPSACLRKFCESLMSRSSREGVCRKRAALLHGAAPLKAGGSATGVLITDDATGTYR
jgi:hypothetical protein